jgi:molybdopterin/thiamine biosynthesis adenylyltransferase
MRAPRLKAAHTPVRVDVQTVRIGSAFGVAAELTGAGGLIWSLITWMDGSRTVAQVAARVQEQFPEYSAEALEDAVEQLIGTGFFEDAATPVTATPGDQERYSRSMAYYSHVDRVPQRSAWDILAAIAASHIVVLGVGGLGSACAYALAASGIGRLTLVDDDVVDLSNLSRQVLYVAADIGRPKVVAAAERLAALRSDLRIDARQARVASQADLAGLFGECDLLVMAADQPAGIDEWANAAALRTAKPWVAGTYDGPLVNVALYTPGEGPCWRCMRLSIYGGNAQLAGPPAVQMATAATANIAGNLAAHIALAQLTGVSPPAPGSPVTWNTVSLGHAFVAEVGRRADCDQCGGPG